MLLKWQVKKLGFLRLRYLLNSGNPRKSLDHFIGNYKIRPEKEKSVESMSEKIEMTSN